jgi:hypothetical protein
MSPSGRRIRTAALAVPVTAMVGFRVALVLIDRLRGARGLDGLAASKRSRRGRAPTCGAIPTASRPIS